MQPLPEPVPGGDLSSFFARFNFGGEENQRLVSAVLVNWAMLTPTYPVLALVAEQGSGKTTATRALRRLIDPNAMDVRTPPKSSHDIYIAATHSHVLALENLSGMPESLADDLCRISTGAAFATRKLYTDDAEQQFRVARPIVLNGIDEMTGRSDLADRSVVLHLLPLGTHARRTEAETWSDFDAHHAAWLGWICSAVQGVLASEEPAGTVRERMADFSVIGAKLEQWLGWPPDAFAEAYRANRERAIVMALETSAIGAVLQRVVDQGEKRMSAGDLRAVLDQAAKSQELKHPGWPRSPRALMNSIRRLSPALRLVGIDVQELGRGGSAGTYQLALRRVR
jgi:ABC-type dipeptide/oligopeptide/nickel transport system ATPase component